MGPYDMALSRRYRLGCLPSFLGGMASVLDLGATINVFNYSKSENEADTKALASDWGAVGEDISVSIAKWEIENEQTKSSRQS